MSRETLEWLNSNTLIGFTDELGNAWHHDGTSDNHFTGAVPVDMVQHLFDWEAGFRPIYTLDAEDDINEVERWQAVVHGDTGDVLNIVSKRYAIHQYNEWLLEKVHALVDASDGQLAIGSAGLLRRGGQAWVQVRPPEYVTVGGERQLPWILATTSHDGSLATQYKAQRQRAVCDNTLAVALGERSGEYRVRHTSGSQIRLGEAREALDVLFEMQDGFDAEVERLMNTTFSDQDWMDLNNLLVPKVDEKVDEDGKVTNQRAINTRYRTIGQLAKLWVEDERVAPYRGTLWGALQAHNTWFHWMRTTGTDDDLSLLKAKQIQSNVTGQTALYDSKVRAAAELVLAGA